MLAMPRIGWAVLASLLVHALFMAWMPPRGGRAADEALPLSATLRLPPIQPRRDVTETWADSGNSAPRLRPLAVPSGPGRAVESPVTDQSTAIDIESARQVARAAARSPASPRARDAAAAPETPLARAIAGSAREDCRSAYAGTGLFALPLLLKDAVTSKGCRW